MKNKRRAERRAMTAKVIARRKRAVVEKWGEWPDNHRYSSRRRDFIVSDRAPSTLRHHNHLLSHSFPSCDCSACWSKHHNKQRIPVGQRWWMNEKVRNPRRKAL